MSKKELKVEIRMEVDENDEVELYIDASDVTMATLQDMAIHPNSLFETLGAVCGMYIGSMSVPAFIGIMADFDWTDKGNEVILDRIKYDWKFAGEDFFTKYCDTTKYGKVFYQWVEQTKQLMERQMDELQKIEDTIGPRKIVG